MHHFSNFSNICSWLFYLVFLNDLLLIMFVFSIRNSFFYLNFLLFVMYFTAGISEWLMVTKHFKWDFCTCTWNHTFRTLYHTFRALYHMFRALYHMFRALYHMFRALYPIYSVLIGWFWSINMKCIVESFVTEWYYCLWADNL
jgi:hypothetical protein